MDIFDKGVPRVYPTFALLSNLISFYQISDKIIMWIEENLFWIYFSFEIQVSKHSQLRPSLKSIFIRWWVLFEFSVHNIVINWKLTTNHASCVSRNQFHLFLFHSFFVNLIGNVISCENTKLAASVWKCFCYFDLPNISLKWSAAVISIIINFYIERKLLYRVAVVSLANFK